MENPNEMTDPAEGRTVPDGDGAAALEPSPGVAPRSGEWTDEDIAKLRQMIGGKAELADGAIPAVLFVTANAIWGLVFLGRALFRWYLMANGHTELLGASAVFLGYPVTAGLVAGSVLYLKRGARRLEDSEPEPPDA